MDDDKQDIKSTPGGKRSQTTTEKISQQQRGQNALRIILCGGTGDGKSTLIDQLQLSMQCEEQNPLRRGPRKYGNDNQGIAFGINGLSEKGKNVTTDVAYHYFATGKRTFIVAETPGRQQKISDIIIGASTANIGLLLIDASRDIVQQTRRHAYLLSLMGIKHIVLAINKMDLIHFDAEIFHRIKEAFQQFIEPLSFESATIIPISALRGDNIIHRSSESPWYSGPTLMNHLETVRINTPVTEKLVFPVHVNNHSHSPYTSVSGIVAEGKIKSGDEIRVTTSGQIACVAEILTMNGSSLQAIEGETVTLQLDQEIEISQGDILSLQNDPLETTDQFEATIVWMNEEAGLTGRNYEISLATQGAIASITRIKHRININTLGHEPSKALALNDIAVCNLAMNKALAFDCYKNSKILGSFILVDQFNHVPVAIGVINHNLRRAQNVHKQALSVSRADREKLNGHKGKVIWFTGLSGSGKSTIANALEVELHAQGRRTYVLDGDNIRQGLNKDLGFTDADRVENIRRIAEVAKLMMDAGLMVMTAFISPFRREREMAREMIGQENFVEVYVSTPLEVCEERDVKGLYKKARAGFLPNMSGIGSPYEPPISPQISIDSSNTDSKRITDILIDAIRNS